MTPRERVLAQIGHEETSPLPYTLSFESEDIMARLDGHFGGPGWRDRLTRHMTVCSVVDTVQAGKISDTYTQDAYGIRWRHDRPKVHLEPTFTEPSFAHYTFPGPEVFIDPQRKEQARREFEAHPDTLRVVNIGWGLFEQSWRIRGFERALMDAAAEPAFYAELIDRLAANYLEFVRFSADLDADAVMFSDDWGDQRGVILGPDRWRRVIKPAWTRIYEEVRDQGRFTISHCCGSVADIMPDIVEMGLDVLESVQPEPRGMNPYELKRQWGGQITFWGGLGGQSIIPFGQPEDLRAEIRHLRQEMGQGGGYILAPAKPLQDDTPAANAAVIVDEFTGEG